MSTFFFDANALVKRYLTETGSEWVRTITDPTTRHTITVAEITRVEVAAALAACQRAPDGLSLQQRDQAVSLLLKHYNTEYQITALDSHIVGRAVELTQNHRLRGYDAMQLATALVTNETLLAANLSGLTFVAADNDLLAACFAEHLLAANPLDHA